MSQVAIPAVELIDLQKYYGDYHALRSINLSVAKGERVVVCGPSGSGKSTMIRCINRLEEHDGGTIRVLGTELGDDLEVWTRSVAKSGWCSSISISFRT